MTEYALALGMFDGVHIGHKAVLDGAITSEYKSLAVTFLFIPFKTGGSLMTAKQKEEKLKRLGVDEVLFLNFDEIKNLEPIEFLNKLSASRRVKKICCGFNYRFGKNALGDTKLLGRYCAEHNIEFFECPEVVSEGETVSSSYIKQLLSKGDAEKAAGLLLEPFSITAEVVGGDKRGRTWGFPTANQRYPEDIAKPKFGVYETEVVIEGERYIGVTNVGIRPTYETDYVSAETFIIDYSGDCYGKQVKTLFKKYLRDERAFPSKEALIEQIKKDAEYVKTHR